MRMSSFLNKKERSVEEPFVEKRCVAELSARALRQNYRSILKRVPGLALLPMVKANAYGHGAEWVCRELLEESSLYGFGVATLEEGRTLRQALGNRGRKVRIFIFSGSSPWSFEKGTFCEKYKLTPALVSVEDWLQFLREGWPGRISYEIKFNTGMNRLGIPHAFARQIARALGSKPLTWHPSGILTHLAQGESPESSLSRMQLESFQSLRTELSGVFPSAHFHFGNSAAIWQESKWKLKTLTDVVRPGISLYGIPPWKGAPTYGIIPVLSLRARVIAVRVLREGDRVGYGGSFRVQKEDKVPVHIAILSAGYADGVHRMLSGINGNGKQGGLVWLGGRISRFCGLVSMDLSIVRCWKITQVGEWAVILGPEIDPWQQAQLAGTIPYELLTSFSTRVKREYV